VTPEMGLLTVTAVYAVFTGLILWEARLSRAATTESANVAFVMTRSVTNELYADLALRNYGPAVATSVAARMWIERSNGEPQCEQRVLRHPVIGPGDVHWYAPYLLLKKQTGEASPTLRQLGNARLTLRVDWSWQDERRVFPLLAKRRTHARSLTISFADVAETVLLEPNVLRPDLESVAREIRDILDRRLSGRDVAVPSLSGRRPLASSERDD
jgi:hypothetical protein